MNTSHLVALAERIGWTLLHSLWQGAVVALLLAFGLRLLRGRSAAARHAAAMLALLAFTALVAGTAWRVGASAPTVHLSKARTAVAMDNDEPQIRRDTVPTANSAANAVDSMDSPDGAPAMTAGAAAVPLRPSWRPRFEPLLPWMSAVWLIGVALLTVRHFAGWQRLRAMRRSGTPARRELQESFVRLLEKFGSASAVRLLESADAAVPLLAGLCKPAVLLPIRVVTGLGEREIEAILAHELAHLVRRDAWSNFAQVAIETLFFYHPAVWWMGRRARLERENAADDLALKVCADRRVYAGALAHLAELRFGPQPALAATGGNLLARIQRIVRPTPAEPLASGWSLGVPALLTALAVVALFRAHGDDAKTINVAPGESIQAAIDAAPPGAIIRLGAGEWGERIVISKPLTLEGAGWEKTRIAIEEPPAGVIRKEFDECNMALEAATSPEAADKATIDLIKRARRPAIFAHSTGGVSLRKLRVQGVSTAGKDFGLALPTLVYFHKAKVVMAGCVIAGPFGQGIRIGGGADVEIRNSLVAAVWDTGIAVLGPQKNGDQSVSRLHLIESEVRNVYHYGIAIGPGCHTTLIERCRISGSAWHGIRYDDASPTISGNTIFQNARFGIYASGKTAATIRGNLIWKNEMEGIWCLSGNADTVEGNTFAGNLRGGIAVSGAKPKLTRNIIAGSPVGISCSVVSGQSALGEPSLAMNLFWEIPVAIQMREEKKAAPDGSISADPQFRDPEKGDFSLVAASPARAANIGVAEPLAATGSWALLAEERSIIPVGETRSSAFWTAPGAPKILEITQETEAKSAAVVKAWVADVFQLDNKATREAAIQRIRVAMTSTNGDEARMGIKAFVQLGPIEFDKASFRPAVRALLASGDAATRAAAAGAFAMTGTEPEDLPRIFALADDPSAEVRDGLTYVIVSIMKRDLTDKGASDAILKLMDKLPSDERKVAHALWGSKFSPEIEARVLEFCRGLNTGPVDGLGYNFFYGALSTQANKSEASVKRLIEILSDQDIINRAGRAAWGLQQGVDRAQFPLVAEAMMKVIEARSDGSLRKNALRCLQTYGNAAQAPALKALLAKPGVTGDFRAELQQTLVSLEKRQTDAGKAAPEFSPQPPPSAASVDPAAKAGDEAARVAGLVEKNKRAARLRAAEDRQRYTWEQLGEIEKLYQVANTKGKRSDEGRTSLTQLLEKYDKANRTGCALLYLGQASEGTERLEYLTRAVEKFSDCYYLNGCQVGGYGRYVLALTLWDKGDKDKASALLAELKTTYKDATDHRGRPISELAEAAEKELDVQK